VNAALKKYSSIKYIHSLSLPRDTVGSVVVLHATDGETAVKSRAAHGHMPPRVPNLTGPLRAASRLLTGLRGVIAPHWVMALCRQPQRGNQPRADDNHRFRLPWLGVTNQPSRSS
jgi:hypothetical protein